MTALATLPDLLGTSPADLLVGVDRHDSTPDEARQRAERLRAGIVRYAEMRQDIADAFACRDWLVLGYDNWPAYVSGEFGDQLAQLARGERQQAVADLRGQGMSTRQIAAATGISKGTVSNDLAQVPKVGHLPETVTGSDGKRHPATRPTPTPGPTGAALSPPADPGATPAPAVESPTSPVAPQEPAPTPEPVATSAAQPVSGEGEAAAPVREGPSAAAESAPAPAPPSLRLDPTDDEKQAAVQRDARGLLLRAVEILAPAHDRPGYAKTWARQLGPYDAELSDLIRRATEAMATLDDLIEGCGQ